MVALGLTLAACATVQGVPPELAAARAAAQTGDRPGALALYAGLGDAAPPVALYERARLIEAGEALSPADRAEALRLYRLAGERGDVQAQLRLGNIYFEGQGVPVDRAEAQRWYARALPEAQARAGRGDPEAQEWLGDLYRQGRGVAQSGDLALLWYLRAAEQGRSSSYLRLARMFERGEAGIAADPVEALRYYELAGSRDNAGALFEVGKKYADGDRVPKDQSRAVGYFERASALGDHRADIRLGDIYADETLPPYDPARAMVWYERAARAGDGKAMVKLAEMLERGRGVPVDRTRALMWYLLATEAGNDRAPERGAKLTARVGAEGRQRAVEMARAWKAEAGSVAAAPNGAAPLGAPPATGL
jgi:TPR repeat protein